jgi:hypothetical protein
MRRTIVPLAGCTLLSAADVGLKFALSADGAHVALKK